LETGEGVITDQSCIKDHIVSFYKKLFGGRGAQGVHLSDEVWSLEEKIEAEDKVMLEAPFSEKEVGATIAGMRSNSAPGPNGFTVYFFKRLWGQIKEVLLKMVRNFIENKLDLNRLNYGVITLVPKTQRCKCYQAIHAHMSHECRL
jgi:hypothetical protein